MISDYCGCFILIGVGNRGWFQSWLKISWQGAKEPELGILKYEIILSFQSIWLILGKYDHLWFWVTGIWAPTFLVKVVTHKLYFSGVTAFSSLSADLESKLKPPSVRDSVHFNLKSLRVPFRKSRHNQDNSLSPTSYKLLCLPSIFWHTPRISHSKVNISPTTHKKLYHMLPFY